METIYRKASVKKRKPQRDGEYYTDNGMLWWNIDEFTTYKENENIEQPHYWFEEIELPTMNEINLKANEKVDCEFISPKWAMYVKGFEDAGKWMRDFVLAVTPK